MGGGHSGEPAMRIPAPDHTKAFDHAAALRRAGNLRSRLAHGQARLDHEPTEHMSRIARRERRASDGALRCQPALTPFFEPIIALWSTWSWWPWCMEVSYAASLVGWAGSLAHLDECGTGACPGAACRFGGPVAGASAAPDRPPLRHRGHALAPVRHP